MKYHIDQVISGVSFDVVIGDIIVASDFNSLPLSNVKITNIRIRTFTCTNRYIASTDHTISDAVVFGYAFVDEDDNIFYNQYPQAVDPLVNRSADYLLKRDIYEGDTFVGSELFVDFSAYMKRLKRSVLGMRFNKNQNRMSFNEYTEKVMQHRISIYKQLMKAYRRSRITERVYDIVEEAV